MATAELDEIVIENVGPVEQLHIPLPEGGGLIVLTGDNGAGKSETLSCCRALAGSEKDKKGLQPKDGEKSGVVEGCGVTIKVGRSNRETGELAVTSLEDRLDIGDLVDPGIIDQNAADARRLKALIRVSGVQADLSLFDALLPASIEIDAKILKETDLITMAAGVKRTLESAARKEETAAEASGMEAATCLKAAEGIDIDAECDEATLQADYRAAVTLEARLAQEAKASQEAHRNQETATQAIQRAKESYNGLNVDEAESKVKAASGKRCDQLQVIEVIEAQLAKERRQLELLESEQREAELLLRAAKQHAETISLWTEQLGTSVPPAPSDQAIADAAESVRKASAALQQGQVIRNAKAKHAEAAEWVKKKRLREKQAEHFRESAKGVDGVLSDLVAQLGCPIKVGEDDKGQRLTVMHRTRGETYFSELSAGERAQVVIPIAINAVGRGGMFVVPQEMWEGLQPMWQRRIAAMLKGSGTWMITAQAADGPLEAKVAS